jgi:hypothetical protein
MSTSFFDCLLSPIKELVGGAGKYEQSTDEVKILPVDPAKSRRTQAAIGMAAFLVNRLEKKDYAPAVRELHKLSPEDRVFVAEKMLWINKQHRSIVASLPHFKCSFTVLNDGRRDLEFIYISELTSQGIIANKSFCFRQDYCSMLPQ